MLDRECTLFSLTVGLTHQLVGDLDPLQMALQNAPGMNPPAWVVGHLTVVADLGCRILGDETVLGDDWRARFAPGSKPSGDLADYPTKDDLVATFADACERLLAVAQGVDPHRLAKPQRTPFFRQQLPTIGDLTGHILTTHPMFHLGQLSAWRRLNGYGPVMGV